jgi:hypothetical protein
VLYIESRSPTDPDDDMRVRNELGAPDPEESVLRRKFCENSRLARYAASAAANASASSSSSSSTVWVRVEDERDERENEEGVERCEKEGREGMGVSGGEPKPFADVGVTVRARCEEECDEDECGEEGFEA